jgi:hypothetical protein
MDLILLVLFAVFIGFIIYVITENVPMPPYWKTAIQVVALILILLFLASKVVHIPNVIGH